MNNSIDLARLKALILRQWLSFGKVYLMALGIVVGLFVSFYGYNLYHALKTYHTADIESVLDFRLYIFVILGIIFITIVSSTYFSNMGDKSKAIFELLIPASSLEKYLIAIFYTFIVPVVSYFLLFFFVDLAFVSYERQLFVNYLGDQSTTNEILNYFFAVAWPKQLYYMSFLPVLLSSLFLLGSIYFEKFHYIKTAISLIAYVFVFIFLMFQIMDWVTRGTVSTDRTTFMNSEMFVLKICSVVGIVITLLVWGIGYMRLKEKEV